MAAKTKKETAAVAETKETAKKATVKKTREVYLPVSYTHLHLL